MQMPLWYMPGEAAPHVEITPQITSTPATQKPPVRVSGLRGERSARRNRRVASSSTSSIYGAGWRVVSLGSGRHGNGGEEEKIHVRRGRG